MVEAGEAGGQLLSQLVGSVNLRVMKIRQEAWSRVCSRHGYLDSCRSQWYNINKQS